MNYNLTPRPPACSKRGFPLFLLQAEKTGGGLGTRLEQIHDIQIGKHKGIA